VNVEHEEVLLKALLDRRPDRERRREVVALDDEVRAVAHADQVELGEELVGGIAGEDVGEAGLDADADEGEPARLLPSLGLRELLVAELHAAPRVGQRHRQVEVRAAGREGGLEDGGVEARVDRVQDRVGPLRAGERRDRGRLRRVDGAEPKRGSPVRAAAAAARDSSTSRQHEALEEVAPLRDCGDGRPHPAGSDHQDPHAGDATCDRFPPWRG
jgi:hypothetical protein